MVGMYAVEIGLVGGGDVEVREGRGVIGRERDEERDQATMTSSRQWSRVRLREPVGRVYILSENSSPQYCCSVEDFPERVEPRYGKRV